MLDTEEILEVGMVLAEELIHQLLMVTIYGFTHHLLLLLRVACSSRWRCRRLACSSSSTITMAATPHSMLKWASCRSNACLLNIVTTAEMTGGSKVTDFYTCTHIWGRGCEHLTMIVRSPAGGR